MLSTKTASPHLPISPESVEVFLVYGPLNTGGIETLILRLSDYLAEAGFSTSIYCNPGGELQASVNQKVSVVNYSDAPDLLRLVVANARNIDAGKAVLILSFDAAPAAYATLIELAIPKSMQVINLTGIFHPKSYFMPGQPLDRVLLNRLLVHAVGKNNIFFMNEECRLAHAKKWGMNLSSSPVIALPIEQRQPVWRPSSSPCIRIVSVGRLVDFKAYNLGAASVVEACRERGVDISWDIFGYGPLANEISVRANKHGVSQQVRLAGKLDYAKFTAAVAGYDVFIGMGTAVIEAAAVGVPAICAVVEEETRSYGYVSDLPFGNVGEFIEGRPMMEIADLLCAYAKSSMAERMQLSAKEVAAARLYGMPSFIKSIFEMAVVSRPTMARIGRFLIVNFYYSMTDGPIARLFFGRGLKTRLMKFMG